MYIIVIKFVYNPNMVSYHKFSNCIDWSMNLITTKVVILFKTRPYKVIKKFVFQQPYQSERCSRLAEIEPSIVAKVVCCFSRPRSFAVNM